MRRMKLLSKKDGKKKKGCCDLVIEEIKDEEK